MKNNGRYYITDFKTGRTFCIEPISNNIKNTWGDVNPVTKKIEGSYGEKYTGSVEELDSIITKENGFKNIKTIPAGISPENYINELLKK